MRRYLVPAFYVVVPLAVLIVILLAVVPAVEDQQPAVTPPLTAPTGGGIDTRPDMVALSEANGGRFIVEDEDILAWQESPDGRFFHLTITQEKADELTALSEAHIGEPLALILEDLIIGAPVMDAPIRSDGRFVIAPRGDDRARVLRRLNPDKQVQADPDQSPDMAPAPTP